MKWESSEDSFYRSTLHVVQKILCWANPKSHQTQQDVKWSLHINLGDGWVQWIEKCDYQDHWPLTLFKKINTFFSGKSSNLKFLEIIYKMLIQMNDGFLLPILHLFIAFGWEFITLCFTLNDLSLYSIHPTFSFSAQLSLLSLAARSETENDIHPQRLTACYC